MHKKISIIGRYFKGKWLEFTLISLFFILLITSLILRNFLNIEIYYFSFFFIILIFFLSNYFESGYKIFIWFALILMLQSILFILINENLLSEISGIHAYIFFILGAAGYLLDYIKSKGKRNKLHIKIYKFIFLFFSILVVISPFIFYGKYMPHLPDIIENVNSQIERYLKKIKHWKNSSQRHRWTACALLEIEERVRRVHNYKKFYLLKEQLKNELEKNKLKVKGAA